MVPTLVALAALLVQGPSPDSVDLTFTEVLAPGVRYDAAIPTLESVEGHDFHEEITPPDGVIRYLEALAAAAPRRARLIEYARSWEGRPLVMLVVGSPERMARLDQVQSDLRRLADPRGLLDEERAGLAAEAPVVVALVHGVHGNEISSSGAAMAEAYHLLAAENDPRVDAILDHALVLIDPMQNPDGRARFIATTTQARARWPSPDPLSAEHDEPWPGGRVNHYLFDLNRDWFLQSQPESRGRVAALLGFMPHVVADLHEMGGASTYYFPPNAVPGNPWTTDAQTALLERVGRRNADAFDERGFPYFVREVYDAFYPGYGVSWPMAQGALGMTFEQASARGLVYRRPDGSLLTYGDGVLHHFTAALTTAHTAATNREEILREFLDFRSTAVDLGRAGPRAYLLHSAHDPAMAARLAETLASNGVEVRRAEEPVTVAGRTLPARETYVVPLDQPAHRLARNLLDPTTPMDPNFVAEQIERRARRERDQIYDVTAWSLPLLWDVERIVASEPVDVATTPVRAWDPSSTLRYGTGAAVREARETRPADARVGWLLPWGTGAASATAELLRTGVMVKSVGAPMTVQGRAFAPGTALVRVSDNGGVENLGARVAAVAARHGADAVALDDAFSEAGTSPGGRSTRTLRLPRILLAYDEPASTYSTGWARYVLERRYGIPVTAIRGESLSRVVPWDFDVIVLPSGDYGSVSGSFTRQLRDWMADGGTLVTMAGSTLWAASQGVDLLATGPERRGGAPAGSPPERSGTAEQPIDLLQAITPETEPPEQTPGAVVNVDLDTAHWLASGTDGRIGVVVEGSRVFTPLTLDRGTNVGVYAGVDELVAGGIVWESAKPQLARKAFLMIQPFGRGQLVAFAEDPNYRAYAEASSLLFVNAVLLGPGR
jgi:hypothetical protein